MISLLIPSVAVMVNLLVQVFSFRRWKGLRYFPSIITGFLAGALAFALMEFFYLRVHPLPATFTAELLLNVPAFLALSYCYYSFVQLGQTSIRIRLYAEILNKPGGLDRAEIDRVYSEEALIQARLERLTDSGDIVLTQGRYHVGKTRLIAVASILVTAKRFLLGKTSEFDQVN